jgi:hypothetical protein
MRSIRRRVLAVAVATGAAAAAGPVSGASAAVIPPIAPIAFPAFGAFPSSGIAAVGGNQIGQAGCVGTNRPSIGGNNGSTSAQTCGAILSFQGAQIGQISSVIGPTIIGSPATAVNVSAGSITYP